MDVRLVAIILCHRKRMRSIVTMCFTFLFFSQLNLSQSLSRGERLILILNPEQPLLHTSSTKFLSFGLDSSLIRKMDKLPISDERFINLARHLSPAYVRIGGTAADCLFFNESPPQSSNTRATNSIDGPDISNFTFSEEDFLSLYQFTKKSGLRMLFDINALIRNSNGSWNESNARKIVEFAKYHGMTLDWQLGNVALLSGQSTGGRKRPPTTTAAAPRHRPTAVEDEEAVDQQESECPEPNGFFADASQCDKYYACSDNKITEKLCPDGMVFNDYSSQQEKCDLPLNIDCSQRPALQTPQPAENCPRQNGYFAHENQKICDKFYYCVDGKFNAITCPGGLVYNEKSGICTWPDEAKKKGCSSQDVFNFRCPNVTSEIALQHPRYANPEDCQFFYVCVNGDTPRRNGCKMGQVFNEASGKCDWPRNVPECADWYRGVLTDEELYNLENPKPKETTKEKEAAAARRKPSRPSTTKRTVAEDDE